MATVYESNSRERRVARALLETAGVIIRPDQHVTYTSGTKSPIYCDNRALLSFPNTRTEVVEAYLALIDEHQIQYDVLGGVATAGIPWGSIIADRLQKPFIYIREN